VRLGQENPQIKRVRGIPVLKDNPRTVQDIAGLASADFQTSNTVGLPMRVQASVSKNGSNA